MVQKIYQVPERVREGSSSPIADLDGWREQWLAAKHDPNGFWLSRAEELVAWRKSPTLGLAGGYHSVTDGPFGWFADGELNVTE
ncbi:MAG: acetyl-coenzyme A synthetase, partial [Myxococcales bacterium]|nr:acetyl-coenzyme A synthetase [Myxococcales bacterium]